MALLRARHCSEKQMRKQIAACRLTICLLSFLYLREEISWARHIHGIAALRTSKEGSHSLPQLVKWRRGKKAPCRLLHPPMLCNGRSQQRAKRGQLTLPNNSVPIHIVIHILCLSLAKNPMFLYSSEFKKAKD